MKDEYDPKPRIIHFGWHGQKQKAGKEKHGGVLTIAYREAVPGTILLGFSFCSRSDNFSKQKGGRDAMQRMRTKSIAFKFLGRYRQTFQSVLTALCMRKFKELENFCGHSLHDVLWHDKFVQYAENDLRLERCCLVPGWAAEWWMNQPESSPLSLIHIGDMVKAGVGFEIKPGKRIPVLREPPPEVKKIMKQIDAVMKQTDDEMLKLPKEIDNNKGR